jgi:outer membrane protein OmpA-like peptidoglycan-associated protein
MRSNHLSGLVLPAALLLAVPAAHGQDLTVEQIVERLQVAPEEEDAALRTRGLRPATPEPNEPNSGQITDMRILFEFDSDVLTAAARDELDKYGEALNRPVLADQSFHIAGHTDAVGTDAYNLDLSTRRAASVVGYLTSRHGVPPDRLTSRGYGEAYLADPSHPRSGDNRRVEIVNTEVLGQ